MLCKKSNGRFTMGSCPKMVACEKDLNVSRLQALIYRRVDKGDESETQVIRKPPKTVQTRFQIPKTNDVVARRGDTQRIHARMHISLESPFRRNRESKSRYARPARLSVRRRISCTAPT